MLKITQREREPVVDANQRGDILGKPPSNAVEVARLSRQQRERLVEALRSMETLETLVRDLMFES